MTLELTPEQFRMVKSAVAIERNCGVVAIELYRTRGSADELQIVQQQQEQWDMLCRYLEELK